MITHHYHPKHEHFSSLKELLNQLLKDVMVQTISCGREDSKTVSLRIRGVGLSGKERMFRTLMISNE